MHKSAGRLGLPRDTTYKVQVRGARTVACFRAEGVSFIRHTTARGVGSGELAAWERPDVLLSMKDAERLEGFLYARWRRDSEARNDMPTSSNTVAKVEEADEQYGGDTRGAAWSSRRQAYADDTTTRTERTRRSDLPETGERESEEDRWTYVQRILTGVKGQGVELKIMFDNNTPHNTLILYTAAARAALVPVWKDKL
jgi:hypothetical protein